MRLKADKAPMARPTAAPRRARRLVPVIVDPMIVEVVEGRLAANSAPVLTARADEGLDLADEISGGQTSGDQGSEGQGSEDRLAVPADEAPVHQSVTPMGRRGVNFPRATANPVIGGRGIVGREIAVPGGAVPKGDLAMPAARQMVRAARSAGSITASATCNVKLMSCVRPSASYKNASPIKIRQGAIAAETTAGGSVPSAVDRVLRAIRRLVHLVLTAAASLGAPRSALNLHPSAVPARWFADGAGTAVRLSDRRLVVVAAKSAANGEDGSARNVVMNTTVLLALPRQKCDVGADAEIMDRPRPRADPVARSVVPSSQAANGAVLIDAAPNRAAQTEWKATRANPLPAIPFPTKPRPRRRSNQP